MGSFVPCNLKGARLPLRTTRLFLHVSSPLPGLMLPQFSGTPALKHCVQSIMLLSKLAGLPWPVLAFGMDTMACRQFVWYLL
eukprot:scaffold155_cov347-Pavlova_lutheri.AAC.39